MPMCEGHDRRKSNLLDDSKRIWLLLLFRIDVWNSLVVEEEEEEEDDDDETSDRRRSTPE